MPRIRINVRDMDEIDSLDDTLEELEEQACAARRNKPRDRIERRTPVNHEMLARKREERRRNREIARYVRQQRHQQ